MKNRMLTLRISADLHSRVSKVSKYKGVTMTDYILNIIRDEIERDELIMEEEEKYLKEIKVPCKCGNQVSFFELKTGTKICPNCGKKVRLLRAPKP